MTKGICRAVTASHVWDCVSRQARRLALYSRGSWKFRVACPTQIVGGKKWDETVGFTPISSWKWRHLGGLHGRKDMRRSKLALLQVERLNQWVSLRGLYLSKKKHSVGICSQAVAVMTSQYPNRRSAPKGLRPRCAGRLSRPLSNQARRVLAHLSTN